MYKFQFLIGTVKTTLDIIQFIMDYGFQFLIGTVKTLKTLFLFAQTYYVSIPHRYCKNCGRFSEDEARKSGFNSS